MSKAFSETRNYREKRALEGKVLVVSLFYLLVFDLAERARARFWLQFMLWGIRQVVDSLRDMNGVFSVDAGFTKLEVDAGIL